MPEEELPGNEYLPEKNAPLDDQRPEKNDEVDIIKAPLDKKNYPSKQEDDEWETVDFPNAISVDSLPVLKTTSKEAKDLASANQGQTQKKSLEVSEITVGYTKESTEEVESASLMAALHECNRELVDRVTELETVLEECQETLENQEKLLEERTQELAVTQEQVTRLFYKLELCNQIIQRQEVLVESLTDKWQQGEQQQAQMERECASTKQSYDHQSYHLQELENSCRELRARLYRQQQQTLQFKVALERCLEMPRRMDIESQVTEVSTEVSPVMASQVSSTSEPLTEENHFISQNTEKLPLSNSKPVKPWSPDQNKQQEESIISEQDKTTSKKSFDQKVDLIQNLTPKQEEASSEQGTTEKELFSEVSKSKLNPSLPSFSRISEVFNYELVEAAPQAEMLEDTEAEEYVVTENDSEEDKIQYQELESNLVEESRKADTSENELKTMTKSERISWNIATGEWNVREYQLEPEKEVNTEDFSEVSEGMEQEWEQRIPGGSKLDLPTWKPPVLEVESVEESMELEEPQDDPLPLATIDLPSFPRIPIDDQPSAVNG